MESELEPPKDSNFGAGALKRDGFATKDRSLKTNKDIGNVSTVILLFNSLCQKKRYETRKKSKFNFTMAFTGT